VRARAHRVRIGLACALLGLALVFAALPLLALVFAGASAASWIHQFCSPAALSAAAHSVGGAGLAHGVLAELAIHWPHLLPLLLGVATVVYLWRADARHRAQQRAHAPVTSARTAVVRGRRAPSTQ